MSTLDVDKIAKSLTGKGFRLENRDHKFYIFFDGDKKTGIYTKISHSEKTISDPLIGKMSRQMHLSRSEFHEFVRCTLSKEQYAAKLKAEGFI